MSFAASKGVKIMKISIMIGKTIQQDSFFLLKKFFCRPEMCINYSNKKSGSSQKKIQGQFI